MRTAIAALLLASCLASSGAHGQEQAEDASAACARAVVDRVQARYQAVSDLRADFTQTIESVIGGPSASGVSRGSVVFAKPGRMRWTYTEPKRSEVISDGQTLWLFDATANEVQMLPVDQGYLAGAGVQFLLGEGDLRTEFRIAPRECEADAETAELELIPRKPATYERIFVRARSASGEVVETTVVDLFGNVTRIEFHDLKLDAGAPPETFRFEVPEGADVIRLDAVR